MYLDIEDDFKMDSHELFLEMLFKIPFALVSMRCISYYIPSTIVTTTGYVSAGNNTLPRKCLRNIQ